MIMKTYILFPNLVILGLALAFASLLADPHTASPVHVTDVTFLPGSGCKVGTFLDADNNFVSGEADCPAKNGAASLHFMIDFQGSLGVVIVDEYLVNQITEVFEWKEGTSYRARIQFDDKWFDVQALCSHDHGLVIDLKSIDLGTVFRSKKMNVSVGAISYRSYDVKGLEIAGPELLKRYQQYKKANKLER